MDMEIEINGGMSFNQIIDGDAKLENENKLRMQLSIEHEHKEEQLNRLRLELKALQSQIHECKMKQQRTVSISLDPLTKDSLTSMMRLINSKTEGIKELENDKYSQAVDREKLVVLHKYQESGVDVHHAYSKYIQSENLKGLRDLPQAYKLITQDLDIEIERKSLLKKSLEDQKRKNEELINETRKKIEEATSFHHSLLKQLDQEKC